MARDRIIVSYIDRSVQPSRSIDATASSS